MSDKKWLLLQIFFGVSIIALIFPAVFLFGERQSDGTYTLGERNVWTNIMAVYVIFSIFFIFLAEVRKRTGKRVTGKTVLLAVLWILGIVLLLSITSFFRQ